MACSFVAELSKLRKLSMESVENTSAFDEFKQYLHVVRPVEVELRELLAKVNSVGKKTLILLCGSAGDGKSHLMSYLKNADHAHLLDSFEVYNDATESSAPELTSIDTLAEKLSAFSDDNCNTDDGTKMILAINLGTLNNFIESEKGKRFSLLKGYVEQNGIFSTTVRQNTYHENSVFQHVSFSDYQVFTLTPSGVGTEYLETLFEKVFRQDEKNPFFIAYTNNCSCPLSQRCPVRHNFEFLSSQAHQKSIIHKIIEVVVKEKVIISTREILNFIYDILVHPKFDFGAMWASATSEIKFLTQYIECTTPMLMYELNDVSAVINALQKHDLLKDRQASMDADTTRFHSLENIYESFSSATAGTSYTRLNETTQIAILGGIKPDLKKLVYRFIVRTKEIKGASPTSSQNALFNEYIQYLYYQHSGNERKLAKLYEAVKKAILNWDGQFDNDNICIDDSNEKFWVLEQLLIQPAIYHSVPSTTEDIMRFSPILKLRFKNANTFAPPQTAEISIDYGLFEMISAMREGYRPTAQDKNQHTDFVSFIQHLIEFGNKAMRIILVPKEDSHNNSVIFEKTDFGYTFRGV